MHALTHNCNGCSGFWVHWMLWQVSALNTLADHCLQNSCISFHLTYLTWSKCTCKWLHWMFWLLIALNALASICLEHSCRPMPCTLLHIIALNTFDWLFVVYSLTDDRIEKILQMIALENALPDDCIECSGYWLH